MYHVIKNDIINNFPDILFLHEISVQIPGQMPQLFDMIHDPCFLYYDINYTENFKCHSYLKGHAHEIDF
jgi:hypothetical protein